MIGYIKGTVTTFEKQACFVEISGIGYRIFISDIDKEKLRVGENIKLYTYMAVREDAIQLYGFIEKESYDLFLILISVSKIGPKVAMGILSSIDINSFCNAIQKKSISVLTKLPGIGKKTAERLVLELKDKIAVSNVENVESDTESSTSGTVPENEAVMILKSLGYQEYEIMPVLKSIKKEFKDPMELVRAVLFEMGKKHS